MKYHEAIAKSAGLNGLVSQSENFGPTYFSSMAEMTPIFPKQF